jgi:hypothetical protein
MRQHKSACQVQQLQQLQQRVHLARADDYTLHFGRRLDGRRLSLVDYGLELGAWLKVG